MIDDYKLLLIKEDHISYDITQLIADLNWQDSVETLGVQLSFTVARNKKDKYLMNYDLVEIGDKLVLQNNEKEIFRGIITDLDFSINEKSVTAFDYAFYLNKSKTIIQFKKIDVSSALKKIGLNAGVNVSTPAIPTSITKLYKDNTIGEIMSDLLEEANKETGKKYFYEMDGTTLNIREFGFETISPMYQQNSNVMPFRCVDAIGEINKKETIQDLKNSIIVTSNDEKDSRVKAKKEDSNNINKFGLIQEVMQVDSKDISKASNIAKNKLNELNKIKEEISISILGNDSIRCGRLIDLNVEEFDIKGKFLIKTTQHSYQSNIHKCSLTLERW